MKTTQTLLIGCLLLLASCASQPLVQESDTGRLYPASHLDSLRGMASGNRDAEQMRFADAIIARAGQPFTEHGTRYDGTVKVIRWKHRGQDKYVALRRADFGNGMIGWQGPNPPSGFYGSRLTTEYLP
jgi:hypothetical protein